MPSRPPTTAMTRPAKAKPSAVQPAQFERRSGRIAGRLEPGGIGRGRSVGGGGGAAVSAPRLTSGAAGGCSQLWLQRAQRTRRPVGPIAAGSTIYRVAQAGQVKIMWGNAISRDWLYGRRPIRGKEAHKASVC